MHTITPRTVPADQLHVGGPKAPRPDTVALDAAERLVTQRETELRCAQAALTVAQRRRHEAQQALERLTSP